MKFKTGFIGIAFFFSLSAQSAMLVTTHDSINLSASNNASGSSGTTESSIAKLDLFDPSLGTLNSFALEVSIESFELGGSAFLSRFGRLNHSGGASLVVDIPTVFPFNVIDTVSDSGNCIVDSTNPTCTVDIADSGAITESGFLAETDPLFLAALTGVGQFDINYFLFLHRDTTFQARVLPTVFGQPQNWPGSATASWIGKTTITYDYDPIAPIPVPAAVWLFATALAGLTGFIRWKSHENRDRFA